MKDNFKEIVAQAGTYGTLHGAAPVEAYANEEAAMLAEILPMDAPEDLYLVTSPPILRELQTKLVERFDHDVREAFHKRVGVAAIAVVTVPDFDPAAIDRLTRDRSDDMIVHTAFEGRAEFIVTADDDLLVDEEGTEYTRLDGRAARAYSVAGFAERLETSKFSLEAVPDGLSVRVGDRPRPAFE